MKKVRQIIAIIGIVLLVALYVSAMVLAFMEGEQAQALLRAAIYCTFIVPVLLWVYSFIYKLVKNHSDEQREKEAASHKNMAEKANIASKDE